MSLISEIVCNYKRGNFKAVTSPPEFMNDFANLMNQPDVQKKTFEVFNSKQRTFGSGKRF